MQQSPEGELRQRKKGEREGGDKVEQRPDTVKGVKAEKVYGRTPDGTVFAIPQTHDVLTGLFDPRLPKSSLDLVTLGLLGSQVLLWFILPLNVSRLFFMGVFAIFRLAYNAGLGYILTKQSTQKWIVNTVKRRGWLDERKHPKIRSWIKRQVCIKLGDKYDFDAHPAEYNIWVCFRHMVDIILLNDFLSYFFCGISYMNFPDWSDSKSLLPYVLRWTAGVGLILFNLWVKMDAHRIITDLAWYWADAFFLSLQDLVFDGVFEMAPHPMYSVGYAGYYGLSLITGSETVLFISLAAHACQFAFLVFFENPHIERTYGERKPIASRKPLPRQSSDQVALLDTPSSRSPTPTSKIRSDSMSSTASSASSRQTYMDTPSASDHSGDETDTDFATHAFGSGRPQVRRDSEISSIADYDDLEELQARPTPPSPKLRPSGPTIRSRHDLDHVYFRHDTIVFANFDILRASDASFGLAIIYLVAAFVLPNLSAKAQVAAIFGNALVWRLIHSFVLGHILKAQSEKKWMVKHFLKHYYYENTSFGAVEEAFANWKSLYNISLCMVYASFGLLALKCYDWSLTTETLRHTLGLLLIALHVWTAQAIYEVIGRFGWFYGDFFIRNEGALLQLYYSGIYRYVNNPEKLMGGAAFFGLALISGSPLVGGLAVFSVLCHFWFLSCVEKPHMKRLYGSTVRKETGVTKTFKGVARNHSHRAPIHVKRAVQEVQGTLERVFDETSDAVEKFLSKSRPRFSGYVENTKVLLKEQGERLMITRVADVTSLDTSAYTLSLRPSELDRNKDQEGLPDLPHREQMPSYQLGEPIQVDWTAPATCSRKDWIGLYRLGGNKSKLVTRIRSQGRWHGIYPDEWDGNVSLAQEGASGSQGESDPAKSGSLLFKESRLFWKTGQYEFRYHHDGKHNVMTVSKPFQIIVEHPASYHSYTAVHSTLLPLVTRCLDSDPALVPENAFPLLEDPPTEEEQEKIHAERTDPDDFVIFTNEQADRIVSVLQESCGVEMIREVVVAEASVKKLAMSVLEAKRLLRPFDSVAENN